MIEVAKSLSNDLLGELAWGRWGKRSLTMLVNWKARLGSRAPPQLRRRPRGSPIRFSGQEKLCGTVQSRCPIALMVLPGPNALLDQQVQELWTQTYRIRFSQGFSIDHARISLLSTSSLSSRRCQTPCTSSSYKPHLRKHTPLKLGFKTIMNYLDDIFHAPARYPIAFVCVGPDKPSAQTLPSKHSNGTFSLRHRDSQVVIRVGYSAVPLAAWNVKSSDVSLFICLNLFTVSWLIGNLSLNIYRNEWSCSQSQRC